MNRIIARIDMKLLSDTIFSSGNSIPGGADITLRTDHLGRPYLPGATVKGLLREHLGNYLAWTGGTRADLDALLGIQGVSPAESHRRLVFGDLRLEQRELLAEDRSYLRTFTRIENGAAAAGSLHSAMCLARDLTLTGRLICAREDLELLTDAFRLIQSVGLKRSRGFGRVSVTLRELKSIDDCEPVPEGHWIHYRLRLETPLAITQGTSAPTDRDRENHSAGLSCIPGSAIRGMVMSRLAAADPQWFAANKKALLQDVIFRSAFPMYALTDKDLLRQIPTPLGFYENRQKTDFYHILDRDVTPGDKRAKLGHYCRLRDTQLLHSSPAMEASLRITQTDPDTRRPLSGDERKMFTSEAIAADALMEGWIYVPDPALAPRISAAFQSWICLGADRYGGSGLCEVTLDDTAPDRSEFGYGEADTIPDTLCMMLLTPTALMHDGEVCGLTGGRLAGLLGVSKVSIERSATAILPYSGFNRKWGCALPTVNMYAPGSIFLLRCSEPPAPERLRELEIRGLGIRRSEGFGQVLFLRDFFRISSHVKLTPADPAREQETRELLERRRARCRWLMKESIQGDLSDSQCGSLQSLCRNVLYGHIGMSDLIAFFDKKIRQVTQDTANYAVAKAQFDSIMTTPLWQTLGCARFEDTEQERLALYCELFDMDRKGEKA